jgi:hypothetical protein
VEFSGAFETHLTILEVNDDRQLAQWFVDRSASDFLNRGWKFLHIVLERGATTTQPMISYRGQGELQEQLQIAQATAEKLQHQGFGVTRIKIEAALENNNIPRSDLAAQELPNCYFEYHLRLLLAEDWERSTLIDLVQPYGAHLSRNARQQRRDGKKEYFVTQRCLGVGLMEAQRRFQDLAKVVVDRGYSIISSHGEYVVYDNHIDLDRGWI